MKKPSPYLPSLPRPFVGSLRADGVISVLVSLLAALASIGGWACKGGASAGSRANARVMSFLMPPGPKRATLVVERKKTYTGYTRLMAPREIELRPVRGGVLYRVKERIDPKTWRTSSSLLLDARADGAWIRAQFGLGGRRVGPRTPRLLFPWPPTPGKVHKVSYSIADGRKATGTVTVTGYGFSRKVGGRTYGPCLEVREVLSFDTGGSVDLRSVYCTGFGRVEILSLLRDPEQGLIKTLDRSLRLKR